MSDRKNRKPKAVSDMLSGNPQGLGGLLQRARQLEALDRAVGDALDPRHAPHVRVANVRDGALILATPVAPIATRLRLEAPRLLMMLQENFPGQFDRVDIKVTPDLPPRISDLPAER